MIRVLLAVSLALMPLAAGAQSGKVHNITIEPDARSEPSEDLPAYYLRVVQEKIRAAWLRPALSRPVVAQFTIERDGRISDVRIETSSGEPVHDDGVMHAIRKAAPFPPLPDSYPRAAVIRLELK